MSIANTAGAPPVHPEFFRLPKPGTGDPFFGFSRSFYYNGEQRGWWKLVRIRGAGKERGVTLIPFTDVLAFVRTRVAESKHEFESAPAKNAKGRTGISVGG